jgi:hypothetical protein
VSVAKRRASNEPTEWKEGQAKARAAREIVAAQIVEDLVGRDMTGDREVFLRRLRDLAEAESSGDVNMVRAAVMELTLAGAAWAVALDLRQRDLRPAAV